MAEFTHIHLSGKHGVNPGVLEDCLDDFYDWCSIFTITEIDHNSAAARLREKGWSFFNAKASNGQDECAVAWDNRVWLRKWAMAIRTTEARSIKNNGRPAAPCHSSNVLLKNRRSNQRLLVSVAHLPAHVEGPHGFRSSGEHWAARKRAYITATSGWSQSVRNQIEKRKPDAALVVSDWNLDLKEHWVRAFMRDHWGSSWDQAWKRFPTAGGSMSGHSWAPLGAPGKGTGDRIIDGSISRGLVTTEHPNLLRKMKASDHRPYKESFAFTNKPGQGLGGGHAAPGAHDQGGGGQGGGGQGGGGDGASGDTRKGKEWWGFGDYLDDEMYIIQTETDQGTVSRFDETRVLQ